VQWNKSNNFAHETLIEFGDFDFDTYLPIILKNYVFCWQNLDKQNRPNVCICMCAYVLVIGPDVHEDDSEVGAAKVQRKKLAHFCK
jgi:hypothetical protein